MGEESEMVMTRLRGGRLWEIRRGGAEEGHGGNRSKKGLIACEGGPLGDKQAT